jgi:DNA-nicking Smr family endonuclease
VKPPRGLTAGEAAAWARLAATVKPLAPGRPAPPLVVVGTTPEPLPAARPKDRVPCAKPLPPLVPPPRAAVQTLDSTWDRKLARGTLEPDFTLDLHGHTLDSAHARLDQGLMQAKAMDARVVLLITGKPRPVDAADRGHQRGAIRAKVLDWLAAGPHGADIAAVRSAHRRHGAEGALYLVLRRRR